MTPDETITTIRLQGLADFLGPDGDSSWWLDKMPTTAHGLVKKLRASFPLPDLYEWATSGSYSSQPYYLASVVWYEPADGAKLVSTICRIYSQGLVTSDTRSFR